MGIHQRGLSCVLELLVKEADEEVVASLWRLFLMYDGLILGPFRKGAQLVSVIKERFGLFLAGDWGSLSTSTSSSATRLRIVSQPMSPFSAAPSTPKLNELNCTCSTTKPWRRSVGAESEPFPCPSGGRGCDRIYPEAESTGGWRRTQAIRGAPRLRATN